MSDAFFRIIILVVVATLFTGCGRRPDTDVTSMPEYNFQSFAGTVWKTKVKVALGDITAYTGERIIVLLPPDCFDPKHPNYSSPPCLEKVIAELPVGTRMRIERLMKDNGVAELLRVTVSLDNGVTDSHAPGKVIYLERGFLAKNRFLFLGSSDSKEWGVDPDLLEKAE